MNEGMTSVAEEALADEREAIGPAVEPLRDRRRLDPVAHAWRACNPRAPLPIGLRLTPMRQLESQGSSAMAERYYETTAPIWALLALATRGRAAQGKAGEIPRADTPDENPIPADSPAS